MFIAFVFNFVFASTHVEYKFSSSFGDMIYDFSGNALNGASGYYGSQKAKSTDRGTYIDGSDHSIVVQETYSNDKLSSPFTINLWTMAKLQPGLIFYRSRSNSNYLSIIGKATDATIGFIVVISGTIREYYCPANSFEVGNTHLGNWVLAQLNYQSSVFTLYTQTCTVSSITLTYSELGGILYYTCLGSFKTNMPAFYGYIWYFNIKLVNEDTSGYVEYGSFYSCAIGPCKTCSYAFKDPDYGNICLSEVTDDTKNSYSETCISSFGCSQSLNFQCSCSTSTCIYSPSANTCGCVDSSNAQTSTSCQCKSPYKSISGKCCNALCSSCATSNECSGCTDPNAEAVSGTCQCKVGYYGTPSSTSTTGCISCSSGCSTCSVSACDSCIDTNAEVISSSCVCKSGYYGTPSGIGANQCYPCGYGCAACTSDTLCNTCFDPNAEALSGSCVCKSGYSGTASLSSTTGCISCSTGCSTCVLTSCDTCSDPNAEVISGSCVCKNGYYGTPSLTSTTGCVLCSQGCSTCVLSICDTCSDPNAEVISSSCVCKSGYYGTPSGIGTDQCYSCGHGCVDCTSNTVCNTCFDSNAEGSTGNCICNSGFYGIASLNNVSSCFACKNKCSVCVDSSTCSVCSDTNAEVESNECVCKTGYYEKISNSSVSTCQNCNAGCQSCTETQCFSCFDPQAQPNGSSCECKVGFYGTPSNDSNSLCIQCGSGCYECTAPNLCLSCFEDNAEVINGECVCKSGFYGTPSESNGCISCIIGCSKCLDAVSCIETFDPNAEVYNNIVRCKNGYFGLIGNKNQSCFECDPECSLCESENACTECKFNNFQLIEGKCECLEGFYSDSTGAECIKCPEDCLTCSNNRNCIECKAENSIFDEEVRCKCMIGYYNSTLISGNKCEECMEECKECENDSTCKVCKNDFTVLNEAGRCICEEGYYNISISNTTFKCKACDSSCKTCDNEGNCINCSENNTEVKENGKCECMNNFYSKINSYLDCENCPGYRIEGKCESFCKSGYGWANGTCSKCDEHCNACDEALRCLNCIDGYNLTDGKCYCLASSACTKNNFKVSVSINYSNQITLKFTKNLKNELEKSSICLTSKITQENYVLNKLSESEYQINLDHKGPSRKIKIEFLSEIVAVDSSLLETNYLFIRTFDENYKNKLDSNSGDFAQNGMLLGLVLTFSIGFLHMDLSNFYNMMNFGEIYSLIALYGLEINQNVTKYMINLRISKELPNAIRSVIKLDASTETETLFIEYGYKTKLFYLNSGMSIVVICFLLFMYCLLSTIPKKMMENSKFLIFVKNYFEYNAFLRYFIQSFLDTALSCSHSLGHSAYNTNTTAFNIYLSLLFIVIIIKIWQFYFYLYTFYLIFLRKTLTRKEIIEKFEGKFESLFKDFRTLKTRRTFFYFIFTTRRYLLVAIIFFVNDPALKLILSFTLSVSVIFIQIFSYLLIVKCFIKPFDNIIHITNELSTMLVYFFIFLSLLRDLNLIRSNLVVVVTVIISASLGINVIGVFISFFKFFKRKFCDKSEASGKVAPIIIEVSRVDDEVNLDYLKNGSDILGLPNNNEGLNPNSLRDDSFVADYLSNND